MTSTAAWRGTAYQGPAHAAVTPQCRRLWHVPTDKRPYRDLGGQYFAQLGPEHAARGAIAQFDQLGSTVTLNPIEDAA